MVNPILSRAVVVAVAFALGSSHDASSLPFVASFTIVAPHPSRRQVGGTLTFRLRSVSTDEEKDAAEKEETTENSTIDAPPNPLSVLPKPWEANNEDETDNRTVNEDDQDVSDNNPTTNGLVFDLTQQWKSKKEQAAEFWEQLFDRDDHDAADDDDHDGEEDDNKFLSSISLEFPNSKDDVDKTEDNDPEHEQSNGIEDTLLKPFQELRNIKASPDDINGQDDANNNNNAVGEKTKIHQVLQQASSLQEATAQRWMDYFSAPGGGDTEQSIRDMVDTARQSAGDEGDVTDRKSFQEVLKILQQYGGELKGATKKYFGDMDLSQLYPTSLFYFIEREDEVKNPSWKRRMHRFFPGVGVERMNYLNDALALARVSYMDSIEEVKQRLADLTEPYELIYCDLNGAPGKPAHYVALKKHQQPLSPALEVVLGIRGTKTITDAITDLLFEDADYRGGKAHSGMVNSGIHVAEKQKPLLKTLLESSGKSRIKLQLVGHSLGGGACSIAAMEFSDDPDIDVEAVGFGCPAMLSQDLSEKLEDCMTTVVADDDVVPRLSAPTVVNALLDVMEFDYVPSARRDIEHAMKEFQRLYPMIVTNERAQQIMDLVDPLMEKHLTSTIKAASAERMTPVLFPPGKIVHFYRDGVGISGSIVPCTMFDQINLKRRCINDHLFHSGYEQIFLDVMRLYFKDHTFQFENPVTPAKETNDTE